MPQLVSKYFQMLEQPNLLYDTFHQSLSTLSGGKYYQKDGERRGYDPEVFSRIFWEETEAEEEEERSVLIINIFARECWAELIFVVFSKQREIACTLE